ncbi:MAG: hypothetical protein ABSH03_20555 [Candidatus Lustribacter sp.]|jgi:hypothetical protein
MNNSVPRWVRARTSGFAHLDRGDRSAQSLRVRGEHIIVTACRGHLTPDAEVVPDDHRPRCSNCARIVGKSAAEAAPNGSSTFAA